MHSWGYFSQVDAVIKSIKHCVQNIQSVFKKHSDCYSYIPIDKGEFVDFWFLKGGLSVNLRFFRNCPSII